MAVRMKPAGSLSPGMMNFAMTPAMNPITTVHRMLTFLPFLYHVNERDGRRAFSKQKAAASKTFPDQGTVVDALAVENSKLDAKLKKICRGC